MQNSPELLDRLVSLTAIRDVELLEFSLLKTLHNLFHPRRLWLARINREGQPQSRMSYGNNSSSHNAHTEDCYLDEEPRIAQALKVAQRLRETYQTRLADNLFLTILPVISSRNTDLWLLFESKKALARQDLQMIQGFVQIYRNYCELIDDAQRDQLTGLLNRRTFDENINRFIGYAPTHQYRQDNERRRLPIDDATTSHWLGIMDIDFFKKINDRFGHVYGDEVLLLTAQLMRSSFRDTDLLFRFGGEEFVVITESTDLDGAKQAFERFRQEMACYLFPQIGQVTISTGVSQIVGGTLAHTILDRADQALYYAKGNGRNQVCIYEDLVDQNEITPVQPETGDVELF